VIFSRYPGFLQAEDDPSVISPEKNSSSKFHTPLASLRPPELANVDVTELFPEFRPGQTHCPPHFLQEKYVYHKYYRNVSYYVVYSMHAVIIHNPSMRGHRGRDRMVVVFKRSMQSVCITTNVVRSNPTQVRCTRWYIILV
jgi:hypothetical protein